MPIDNQIASRRWRSRRTIPTISGRHLRANFRASSQDAIGSVCWRRAAPVTVASFGCSPLGRGLAVCRGDWGLAAPDRREVGSGFEPAAASEVAPSWWR
jgi:hypothetical protein